jgi:hypothetical protein
LRLVFRMDDEPLMTDRAHERQRFGSGIFGFSQEKIQSLATA